MSDQEKKDKKLDQQEWNNRAKEIWLAGLGALSAVEEEGSKLFKSLVNRGTEFEKKSKDQINEMWEEVSDRFQDVEKRIGDSFEKAEDKMEKNIRSIVSGMGIPTRKEVKELSHKVDKLAERLEKMSEDKPAGSGEKKSGKSRKSTKST